MIPLELPTLDRRTVLGGVVGLAAVAAMPKGAGAATGAELVERAISIDIHSHPGPAFLENSLVPPALDRIAKSPVTAFTYSVVSDTPLLGNDGQKVAATTPRPGQLYDHTKKQLRFGLGALKNAGIEIATTAADIERAKRVGTPTAILAIEGGDFAEGNLAALEEVYALGIRVIQPVHKRGNNFADSQEHQLHGEGLSDAGQAFINELNRLRILIDVSHMTQQAVAETAEATAAPLILSHVIHTPDPSVFRRFKRWATPDYTRVVVETGGLIGVWNLTSGIFPALGYRSEKEMYIDTFRMLADAYGVDHVCLGTDLDAIKGWFDSYNRLPELADELKIAGFSEAEVVQLLGGNVLRVLRNVVGA
ncbi:MAG: membrane dipeptidase [Alphaproteobacteria bacterium]|nr:membrane dipeptidase [Alphaproteobacteria bacterium]